MGRPTKKQRRQWQSLLARQSGDDPGAQD
jgi:hypothetical protein